MMIKIENGRAQAKGDMIHLGIETVALIDLVLDTFKDSIGAREAVYFLNEMIKLGITSFTDSLNEAELSGKDNKVPHEYVKALVDAFIESKPENFPHGF